MLSNVGKFSLDRSTSEADLVVLFGDFNAYVGVDSKILDGVIGKNKDPDEN